MNTILKLFSFFKRFRSAVVFLTALSIIFLSAIFLGGCKKNTESKDPVAVNVRAESIGFVLNPTNDKADKIYLGFTYNGVKYSVSTGRVDQGSQNGSLAVADTNVIASNSTLSEEIQGTNVITVTNPASNAVTIAIDKFIFVYGSGGTGLPTDVKDFNKITLSISAATKFTVTGYSSNPDNDTWATTYVANLPGFTTLMSSVASQINNNTPFVITVSK
jgi:hypothetical protein